VNINQEWKLTLDDKMKQFLDQSPVSLVSLNRYDFPKSGGVYMFSNISDSDCVYVGQSIDLRDRVFDTHLNGKGRSSFRDALLGLKITRKHEAITIEDQLDDFIESNFLMRFVEEKDTTVRGCFECYLIALLKPKYSVPLGKK
jgi:hypothetical protein